MTLSTHSTDMTAAAEQMSNLVDLYIAVWNETDAARRAGLIAEIWAADASYRDPLMQGDGHAGISQLVAAVHERFPAFRFSRIGEADFHGDHLRFSWALGLDGEEAMVKGTDYAVLEQGRLRSVTGFLDQVPA
ncbi:hypothetical protein PMI16_01571 [Herbaspirillum sp. CF444]|uniref:nuclear transport factor 2 family protein n=1 Tax=Herbaspirillum sp. CF444 TaxID=1144319 RepID=UPI0002726E4C|nr:nuclear transport factor 2 family protein [Herbaspirillum sp. CF444]EJL91614.1 hypothetical protein PMI16_01571 [Herbaspirillum sp. CF444]